MMKYVTLWLVVFLSVGQADSGFDSFRSKVMMTAVSWYFANKGYGKVENISVDTAKKTINFLLLPEGETQKLSIAIGEYQTATVDQKEYLVLKKIETNRVWLNRIFADHLPEGIKIPLNGSLKGAGSLFLNL